MNPFEAVPREIIPRWRDLGTTARLGELGAIRIGGPPHPSNQDEVGLRRSEWELNRTVPFAADLMSAAVAAGDVSVAADAISFLASESTSASGLVRRVARNLLRGSSVDDLAEVPPAMSKVFVQAIIQTQKARVRFEPRDALAWAELARGYILLGFPKQADRAMRSALALAPNNRFLLRSAARLFVHIKEFDQALRLLQASPASAHDSWLIAAEIAIAGLCHRAPKLTKAGLSLISRDEVSPFHLTELASALGTLEASSGNYQRAKKLFRKALQRPNENSVAQAVWAARTTNVVAVGADHLQIPLSFEARALSHYQKQEWTEAYRETIHWLQDQPFATEPAIRASYIAAVVLDDYQAAIDVIEFGQIANPQDWTLRNNLAFAHASADHVDKAADVFHGLSSMEGQEEHGVWLATAGLIEFRAGRFDRGVAFYREAIDEFSRRGMTNSEALASAFLAREAIRANIDFALEAAALARRVGEAATVPEIPTLLSKLDVPPEPPPV